LKSKNQFNSKIIIIFKKFRKISKSSIFNALKKQLLEKMPVFKRNPNSVDIVKFHVANILSGNSIPDSEIPPQYRYDPADRRMQGYIDESLRVARKELAEKNKRRKLKEAAKKEVQAKKMAVHAQKPADKMSEEEQVELTILNSINSLFPEELGIEFKKVNKYFQNADYKGLLMIYAEAHELHRYNPADLATW
jgi:hypothetical protein